MAMRLWDFTHYKNKLLSLFDLVYFSRPKSLSKLMALFFCHIAVCTLFLPPRLVWFNYSQPQNKTHFFYNIC